MRTHGVTITPEQEAAAIARMREGPFVSRNIEGALTRAGVVDVDRFPVVMRTADKLLQRERKAGRIRFEAGRWLPA